MGSPWRLVGRSRFPRKGFGRRRRAAGAIVTPADLAADVMKLTDTAASPLVVIASEREAMGPVEQTGLRRDSRFRFPGRQREPNAGYYPGDSWNLSITGVLEHNMVAASALRKSCCGCSKRKTESGEPLSNFDLIGTSVGFRIMTQRRARPSLFTNPIVAPLRSGHFHRNAGHLLCIGLSPTTPYRFSRRISATTSC